MENIDINRKHSYTQKIDIIHCYIPFYEYQINPTEGTFTLDGPHPENPLTEQRICDQQRVIMKKANTQEVHGSRDMKYIN